MGPLLLWCKNHNLNTIKMPPLPPPISRGQWERGDASHWCGKVWRIAMMIMSITSEVDQPKMSKDCWVWLKRNFFYLKAWGSSISFGLSNPQDPPHSSDSKNCLMFSHFVPTWDHVLLARILNFFGPSPKCHKVECFESSGWQKECFESQIECFVS